MDKAEELMSMFPEVTYIYDANMPEGLPGLNVENSIYLNPNVSNHELNSAIAEELGHYLTTVGNIVDQKTNEERKQERKARDVGAILIVTPYDIVDCFNEGCQTAKQCAAYLEVTEQTFTDAIKYYARRFDGIVTENKHIIFFKPNGTVGIYKSLID